MFLAVRHVPARVILLALLISAFLFQPLGPTTALVPPSIAFAQSIPYLAQWESNMRTYGSLHCVLSTLDQVYYDAERVYYQIADYTRDSSWINCSQLAETVYRDQYVLPNNGNVPGHWNFTTGLRIDAQRSGDATSQNAVFLLSENAAFARDGTPLSYTTSADYSREVAYAILSYIDAGALGQPPRQRRLDLMNQAYDHMAQWFVRFAWPGPWQQSPTETSRLAPFMVGLTAHTLIRDWEQTHDSRLIPALRLAADWMWANAWIPSAQAMWYEFPDQTQPCCVASGPAPDLNLLVAPIYAFLYWQTGDTKYRDQGDAIFAGGVAQAWLGGGKQFDQNYWWSFDYVKWRTAAPADTSPPAVSLTAPANGSTVSGSAVAISATASDNVGVAKVQFMLDGANVGPAITTPPYGMMWNTTTTPDGSHLLAARAYDAAGNVGTAAVSVTVANNTSLTNTTPPAISWVAASSISTSSATITWTTDKLSDSQVEYGLTTAYGSMTQLNATLVTAHAQGLSGLAAGTLYHFRVKSKDVSGNLGTSGDFTFTTAAASAPGPAARWPLDDGTGTVATDASGHGHNGALINGPSWTTGKIGGALAFDGLSMYVEIPSASDLNAYPFTVAAWFKTTSASGVRGIVNKYVSFSMNGWGVFLNNGNLCAWYYKDSANYVYRGGGCPFNLPGYNNGQWHHVAFAVDAAGGRLYVDGQLKGKLAWTGIPGAPSTTQPVHLARYPGGGAAYPGGPGVGEYFPGLLDEVRIYSRALSNSEVRALFFGSTAQRPADDLSTVTWEWFNKTKARPTRFLGAGPETLARVNNASASLLAHRALHRFDLVVTMFFGSPVQVPQPGMSALRQPIAICCRPGGPLPRY